jgi:DNA-binding response OmpR family regulator
MGTKLSQRIIANCRGDGGAPRSIDTAASGGVGSGASGTASVLRSGDLELDLVLRTAARSGKAIDLRPKEFPLLECLVRNVNRPVTRTMIHERIWNSSFEGLTNMV